MIATDQTGMLPIISQRGNKYIMILYSYDSNAILAEPVKGRTGKDLVQGYNILYDRLVQAGVKHILQRLDNEASKALIEAIEEKELSYQLAPPYSHRTNIAERAVQTFKNHFISNLHGCDTTFPGAQWCRLIPQCEMTLNMLRRSRINPKLSAYTQTFGIHNYNQNPLAPLGTKTFVHERPEQRRSHADHGKIGYVIGPAMHHYRHLEFYIPASRGVRKSDTYVFLPTKFELPASAAADRMTIALEELTNAITNHKDEIPFTDHSVNKAIDALTNLISHKRASQQKDVTAQRVSSRQKQQQSKKVNITSSNSENVPEQRVLRQRVPRHKQVYTRGTRVYKMFNNKYYRGYICDFDDKEGYYKVKYEDGDIAEYNEVEIEGMRHKPDKNNIILAMAATRFERVQEEYSKTKSSYTPPSQFSAGYAHAIDFIEMGMSTMPYQGYKYANVVIDEESGKPLEYRDLLKHEKYKDTWTTAGSNEYGRLFQGCGRNADGTQRITGTNACH